MADISKITLPSGNTYDVKDETAREMIANLNQFTYNVVNTLPTASADTMYQIYLIQSQTTGVDDEYEEYITLDKGAGASPRYKWEMLGTITAPDLSDYVRKDEVGDLAYKDTASGSTSVNVPATYTSTFTGEASNVTVSGTTTGSVNVTKSAVTVSKASSGTATYTPQGSNAASSVSGSCTITPSGSISTGSGTANYTPAGTVTAPTITVDTAGATTSVAEVASVGSMPTYTVANEVLTITAGAVPTTNSVTVKTGDASYTSSAPAFTGTGVDLEFSGTEVTGTVTGTAAAQTFTGTGARLVTDSQVATDASFVGDTMSSTGNVTPTGSVSTTTATTESKTINVTVS